MSANDQKCAICEESRGIWHVTITDAQGVVEDSDWFCAECVWECMTSLAVRKTG